MRRISSSASVIVCVLTCLVSKAEAQFACPEASSPEQATRLAGETFSEGERLYTEGDHREAIVRFECSYSLSRHPNTLFNIARAAELLEDWPLARSTYQNIIDRFPENEGIEEAREHLRAVEARLEDSTQNPVENQENLSNQEDPESDPQPPQAASQDRMSGPRIGAWVTLGLGLVLSGTGAGLYGGAHSIYSEIPEVVEPPDNPDNYRDERDRGKAFETAGWALMGTGLATLVLSVVLFTVFDGRVTSSNNARLRLLALPSPGGLVLVF